MFNVFAFTCFLNDTIYFSRVFSNKINIIMYVLSTVTNLELIITSLAANSILWLAQWIFSHSCSLISHYFHQPSFLVKINTDTVTFTCNNLEFTSMFLQWSRPFSANMLLIPSLKASLPVWPAMCNNEAKKYTGVPGLDKENSILSLVN